MSNPFASLLATGPFEQQLRRHEADRHRAVFEDAAPEFEPHPPGFRAEDVAGGGPKRDGFLPIEEGSRAMGMDEADLLRLVAEGKLEARRFGDEVYVQPAIVTVLAVMA